MFRRASTSVPVPQISQREAIVAAKKLALFNNQFWDDGTVTAQLRSRGLPTLCWEVMPGTEFKEWAAQELDDYPPCFLIDAETGKFVGLSYTRHIALAEALVGKTFKLPET